MTTQHIGRVGALALALGVGAVITALPAVASADTGNSGKSSSSADSSSKAGPKARGTSAAGKKARAAATVDAPVITVSTGHSLRTTPRVKLDKAGGGSDPVATPLELAALALRRELSGASAAVVPASVVTTGEPAAAVPAAGTTMADWTTNVAPVLTNFIKTQIGYVGLSTEKQAFVDAVLPSVVELMGNAYTKTSLGGALTNLANNQTLLNFVTDQVQTMAVANGLTPGAAHVAGQAMGYLAQTLLGNTAVQNAVTTLAHTLTVVPNGDLAALLANLNSPTYTVKDLIQQDVLQSAPAFITGIPVLLADQALRTAVFSALKGSAHVLVGLSGWQEDPSSAFVTFIGDQVELAVGGGTTTDPVTAVVALAGRAAVEHILSSAVIIDGAVGTVETGVSTFLDYAGVNTALVGAANTVAQVVATGTEAEVQAAYDAAMQTLSANPAVQAAFGQALKGGVKAAVGNAGMLADISATVKTFLTDVATDPVIKAAVLLQFGPKYGGEIAGVLDNTAAIDKLAGAISGVLPKFLGARGVSDALGEAVNQAVLAMFAGGTSDQAVSEALKALQADPAFKAALKSTVAAAVRGVLGVQALEQAAARITSYAIQDFFDSSGINNPTLERLAANALKSVVYSLLGDGSVRTLVGSLAGDLAIGKAPGTVVKSFLGAVLSSPGAQLAFGQAFGQAVGSLFGGGPVGFLVGQFFGIPTGLFIAVNALPALLLVRSGLLDGLFAQLNGLAAVGVA
ncbi:hypothetical protein EV580_5738 [Mycobacterium sp. BK086]|uniref:hypothetical protein n=1 Tax=Mycobacterium sp. BK086 TaxID=2512165 RepID=UPI00105B35A6|nr:hypothetical protein [Mycobacterium sp. BK086]TDO08166.1 hypothetical protein EV580_5738 [Mycobacterium sp. BK086]